jgi:hypothetical protein
MGMRAVSAQSLATGKSLELAQEECAKAVEARARIISLSDPEYPSRLKEIYDPPVILFVKGSVEVLAQPGIAMVGTRHPTPYGSGMAERLSTDLAARGLVAYASDESGVWEIYVTSFPGAAGKWQVSRGGGSEPRWRGDGKEIFYIAPSGMLTAVPVNGESIFATGTPAPLFQIHGRAPISSTDVFTYDVAKDGNRFLVNRYVKPEHVPPLTILLNAANGDQYPQR